MQIVGTLKDIRQNIITGEAEVTFTAEDRQSVLGLADSYREKRLRIEVKQYREKRSLTANGYYWVLIAKLAGALGVSNARMHNRMLRRYGQPYLLAGQIVEVEIPDTEEAENWLLEDEREHLIPTNEIIEREDGSVWRIYRLLRGSHDYDTAEFSQLIGGLVSECKDTGIETLPPDELARMMLAYKGGEQ